MNENPKNFFDRVKFAMRDGTVTLIPLGDSGFKIVFEFKRNPDKYLTNTGELEITVAYLGSPPALKEYAYSSVRISYPSFVPVVERAFGVTPGSLIIYSGYCLMFAAWLCTRIFA